MMALVNRVGRKLAINEYMRSIAWNFSGNTNRCYKCKVRLLLEQRRCFTLNSRIMDKKNDIFQFTTYDCIGFDLDNTVARYKVGAMIEMEYKVMAKFLIENKGYPKEYLLKPFDHNFILKGLIMDDANGNLLRIGHDGRILIASHGTNMLDEAGIERYYPNKHWEASDLFAKDPLSAYNGPYSKKMRTFFDYFDISASLIFARIVNSIDEKFGGVQKKYEIWPDLLASLEYMFERNSFQSGKSPYFNNMKNNPDLYYYKCSDNMLSWLRTLKQQGKMLYLITGAHVDFASHTASNTIGPDWRSYFDIVVCFAKKPGFFNQRNNFLALDGLQELGPVKDLKLGEIYTHGNWTDLHSFFMKHIKKENPRFLYVGDHIIQDIYAPNVYSHCETVVVCEELEAEGKHGYQAWHPDQQFLVSTVWGSYFYCNDVSTNWYDIMKKHSKICVPSLEYVASLPIDYQYKCNEVD